MKRFSTIALACVCCAGLASADASFHQVMEIKFNMPMGMMPGAAPGIPGFPGPMDILCRIKGTHSYSTLGPIASIQDSAKGEVILLDTAGKRYATTTLADYIAKMADIAKGASAGQMPEAARQILQNMQFKVESHETGRSQTIAGVDTAETEMLLTITIPLPMPGANSKGMEISGKFQVWKPKAAELERLPALREINLYYRQSAKMGSGIPAMMTKIFSAFPGMGDKMGDFMAEMQKGTAFSLRMHGEFSVPALAAILQQAKEHGANVPSLPDGPLFEINSDLKDLNTDTVADSIFQVPEGYSQAPVEDLVKALVSAAK